MGRTKHRNKDNRVEGQFVAITFEMTGSRAYRKLTGSGLKALILFLKKVKTHRPLERYTYQFPLSFPEAEKNGVPESSFNRALTQLIELGFIDCVIKGGMRYDGKSKSYYKLSKRWKTYGTPHFNDRHRGHCESIHGTKSL